MIKSRSLHHPINAPQLGTFTCSSTPEVGPAAAPAITSPCPSPTIDLNVLIIASDGQEVELQAIKQALDYLGTSYTIYVAPQTQNGLTPDKLSNGCHGFYQGVILTNGTLSYY